MTESYPLLNRAEFTDRAAALGFARRSPARAWGFIARGASYWQSNNQRTSEDILYEEINYEGEIEPVLAIRAIQKNLRLINDFHGIGSSRNPGSAMIDQIAAIADSYQASPTTLGSWLPPQ